MERGIPEGDQATDEALADGKSVYVYIYMARGITEGDRATGEALVLYILIK